MQSLLMGMTVVYSITKDTTATGIIVDKVLIKERPDDPVAVTAYMIEDDHTGALIAVSYWRIKKVKQHSLNSPTKHLKGGYRRN